MPPILRSKIHLTPPETVRRVQTRIKAEEEARALSQEKARRKAHPNLRQCSLLRKLTRAKGKPLPPSNRGTHKKRKALTTMNRDERLVYIMEAVEEIAAAKRAERAFISDFERDRQRKVAYSPKAPRKHKKVVAWEVLIWLQSEKLDNFCLNTVKKDLSFIKKNSTYTI